MVRTLFALAAVLVAALDTQAGGGCLRGSQFSPGYAAAPLAFAPATTGNCGASYGAAFSFQQQQQSYYAPPAQPQLLLAPAPTYYVPPAAAFQFKQRTTYSAPAFTPQAPVYVPPAQIGFQNTTYTTGGFVPSAGFVPTGGFVPAQSAPVGRGGGVIRNLLGTAAEFGGGFFGAQAGGPVGAGIGSIAGGVVGDIIRGQSRNQPQFQPQFQPGFQPQFRPGRRSRR